MAGKNFDDSNVRCSFCGKSQYQVKRLIAGPEDGSYSKVLKVTVK